MLNDTKHWIFQKGMDELVQVKKVLTKHLLGIWTSASQNISTVQLICPLLITSYHNSVFLDSDLNQKPNFYNTAGLC